MSSEEFRCSNCGQIVPESAGFGYLAGLLIPPACEMIVTVILFWFDVISSPLFYAMLGAMGMGAWMLMRTDPHLKQTWREFRAE